MQLANLRTSKGTRAARVDPGERRATLLAYSDVADLLRAGLEEARGGNETVSLDDVSYAPVVVGPRKIICIGLNYRGHVEELGLDLPTTPLIFPKFPLNLIGAHDPIQLPPDSSMVDWEAELVIVIGRRARRVSTASAPGYIAGYTVGNDISMRDWLQKSLPGAITQAKAWDNSSPVGPVMVTPDEVNDGRDLRVQTFVDEVEMQDGRTSDLIFTAADLIAYVSTFAALEPGDLIFTGTPAGVGMSRKPPVFLKPGQTVRTVIEGIGELRNRVVPELKG